MVREGDGRWTSSANICRIRLPECDGAAGERAARCQDATETVSVNATPPTDYAEAACVLEEPARAPQRLPAHGLRERPASTRAAGHGVECAAPTIASTSPPGQHQAPHGLAICRPRTRRPHRPVRCEQLRARSRRRSASRLDRDQRDVRLDARRGSLILRHHQASPASTRRGFVVELAAPGPWSQLVSEHTAITTRHRGTGNASSRRSRVQPSYRARHGEMLKNGSAQQGNSTTSRHGSTRLRRQRPARGAPGASKRLRRSQLHRASARRRSASN